MPSWPPTTFTWHLTAITCHVQTWTHHLSPSTLASFSSLSLGITTHLVAPRVTWEASCFSFFLHPRQVIRHSPNSQLRFSPWLDSTQAPLSPLLGQASMLAHSSVQSLSHVWLFVTPCPAARQASLSITNSWSSPKPCPLSRWCHPTISSSVVPFSSCPQSFPASGSFQMGQLFTSGGQSI